MTVLPGGSVLVRTWFGDDNAWESLVLEVRLPSPEGFLATVTLVNDPAFAGLTADGLTEQHPGGALVSFLADETTLNDPEHQILAVWLLPPRAERPHPGPFRVVPAELWSVENNLNLGNLDWADFTRSLDATGVYRGL